MKRVVIVVSSVGYQWEELFRGYWAFRDAGWAIELYTVEGKPAFPDPLSLKRTGPGALFGLGMPASIAPDTERGTELLRALDGVKPLAMLDAERPDAIYLPGGHGCLFDVNRNVVLHAIIRRLHQRGCVLSAVCHATSTFAFVENHGKSIVAGHRLTGFPHALDRTLIPLGLVRREFLPLPLVNDRELRRAGAKHSRLDAALAYLNPRHMRRSAPFITGVGPKAAARVARAVIARLDGAPAQIASQVSQASLSRSSPALRGQSSTS
jgi:putative intracellular protease/amidase